MGMKRRYLAVLMGIMVATTSVPAMVYAEDSKTETAADAANDESGEADASDENGDESQENVVLGEVKSVSDSEITIAVGTMKEMGQPGGDGQNGGAPDGNGQGGEAPSGQDGEAPEKPEGDGQDAEDSEERIRARMRRVQTMVIPQMQRRMLLRIARMQMARMVEYRMETVRVVRRLLCWI